MTPRADGRARRPWPLRIAAPLGAVAVVVVVVALGSNLALFRAGDRLHTVRAETMRFKVRAQGTLESVNRLVVSPPVVPNQWNFTITFLAPEGKEIAAGQPAVGFDAKRLEDSLQVQRAQLAAARKELEKVTLEEQERLDTTKLGQTDVAAKEGKARRKLDVPEDVLARNELLKSRLDLAEAQQEESLTAELIDVQKANLAGRIESSRAKAARLAQEVAETEESIRRLAVAAPRNGFVVYVPDWNNRKLVVGDSVWFGQQILEIADLSTMRVAAVVPEPDAGKVRTGQRVEVRLDANPDRLFHGRVASLGRIFRAKSWDKPSVVFDATILLDDPDPALLRPGMAAEVVILAETERPVLQVPEVAVFYGPSGAAVRARGAGGVDTSIPVRLGWRSDGSVEVREGLRAGDVIVVPKEAS